MKHPFPLKDRVRRPVYGPKGRKMGRNPGRLFAFGPRELADLLDCTEQSVGALIATGKLDPTDIRDVCRAWIERVRDEEEFWRNNLDIPIVNREEHVIDVQGQPLKIAVDPGELRRVKKAQAAKKKRKKKADEVPLPSPYSPRRRTAKGKKDSGSRRGPKIPKLG